MDRDAAVQTNREQLEVPVWGFIEELEKSLSSLAGTSHVDFCCPRAVGSVLNCAPPSASLATGLGDQDLEVTYCRNGECNKLSGEIEIERNTYKVSVELHLSGPRGGTTKKKHQFAKSNVAVCDIEQQPLLLEYDVEAPDLLTFFIACHLGGTGVSIARAYFKFADGVVQRMLEINRPEKPVIWAT